jgi:hypothetical protein
MTELQGWLLVGLLVLMVVMQLYCAFIIEKWLTAIHKRLDRLPKLNNPS